MELKFLRDHNFISEEFKNEIETKLCEYSANKSQIENILIDVIGLSGNTFSIFISEYDYHMPIVYWIHKVIYKDLAHWNLVEFRYYLRSYSLYLGDMAIFKECILAKIPYTGILRLTYNSYGNSKNFDKNILAAICPITLEPINIPIICSTCENSFEYTNQIKGTTSCPICRCDNFYNNCLVPPPITTPFDLYWMDFLTKTDVIKILTTARLSNGMHPIFNVNDNLNQLKWDLKIWIITCHELNL